MNEELTFRLIFAALLFGTMALRSYYRIKAKTYREPRFSEREGRWARRWQLIALPFLLVILAFLFWPPWMQWATVAVPAAVRWLGVAVGVLGAGLLWWVQSNLGRNFSTTLRLRSDHVLITSGPYRWVRHPMYTALLMLYTAYALIAASWFLALIVPLLLLLFANRLPGEEAMMMEKFGDEYQRYVERTGRDLPRLFPARATETSATSFPRPHRLPVVRLFNGIARTLRAVGLCARLTEDLILRSARKRTGLSDFGDDRFREGLRILTQSLEETADLAPSGRLGLRMALRHLACNRLWIRQHLTAHPQILEQRVSRPVFIVGLPRTGTTLLFNLLCQDRRARYLRFWEALQPAPAPKQENVVPDPRIAATNRFLAFARRAAPPNARSIHPITAEGPEECYFLLLNTFICPVMAIFGHIPEYMSWLRQRTREELLHVYEEYRQQLLIAQYHQGGERWVLKSPVHAWGLDALLTTFPDACVIQTHRDMNRVLASLCSLVATSQAAYSDRVDLARLGASVAESLLFDRIEPALKARAAHPNRVFDVYYDAVIKDPIAVVRTIYDHFGLPLEEETQERMQRWLIDNPKDKFGAHRYSLEQFGLNPTEVQRLFGAYQEQLRIPEEK